MYPPWVLNEKVSPQDDLLLGLREKVRPQDALGLRKHHGLWRENRTRDSRKAWKPEGLERVTVEPNTNKSFIVSIQKEPQGSRYGSFILFGDNRAQCMRPCLWTNATLLQPTFAQHSTEGTSPQAVALRPVGPGNRNVSPGPCTRMSVGRKALRSDRHSFN